MFGAYLEQLQRLVQDPTGNLVAAAIGVSIVVIILVIVVLLLLFFALTPHTTVKKGPSPEKRPRKKPKPPSAEELARREAKTRRARFVTWSLVSIGLLGAWIALFAGTSVNTFCTDTCHSMVDSSATWEESIHSGVRCVRCHEGAPPATLLTGSISRVRSAVRAVTNSPSSGGTMPSQRCLTCHRSILNRTVITKRAIAMSHAEPIEGGAACTDCHGAQGHADEVLAVGMPACLRCHDGVKATAECRVCHPKGIEASIAKRAGGIGSPVRLPERPTCDGCHSQESCDACHGIRMPHPTNYKDPRQHAMPAAFDRKNRLCYRCHVPTDCVECHPNGFDAHGANWKREHAVYKRAEGSTYCLWCHKTENFCAVCHGAP